MPAKYEIHTSPSPHRFEPVSRSGIIAWEEGCLKCPVCVKTQCVYGVYERRGLDPRQMIESIDNQCMNCLRCVQSCPGQLIHKSINPEYREMGDSHWSPEIISSLWSQAETGKIPVSGAGYSGPFSGAGFDSMWTDMSEIVRPTRDGIHGREYISSAVDLGERPVFLEFKADGSLKERPAGLVSIPLPIIFRRPAFGSISGETITGWAKAAETLGTFFSLPLDACKEKKDFNQAFLMPQIDSFQGAGDLPNGLRMVELDWDEDWQSRFSLIRQSRPEILVSVRIPAVKGVEERAVSLVQEGVSIIHLEGSSSSRFIDDESRYVKDAIRSVHLRLTKEGIRENASLVAGGGFAMAEHVAKALICGADAVFIDFALLIALECRMCRRCEKGLACPVDIDKAPAAWVSSRLINLIGAWRNQLLEVMGAMGIRDVRRLRGEVGRAMFFEELDRETFGNMSEVEDGCELE